MPVNVHIPARVVVDARALLERRDSVEEAFRAALGRALKRARAEVLDARGGFVGARLHVPQFSWTGDDLSSVTAEARARTEAMFADIVAELGAAGVANAARDGDEARAASASARATSELLDERRYTRLLSTYMLPSYNGGGAEELVPVEGSRPGGDTEPVWGWVWETFELSNGNINEDELFEAMRINLEIQDRSLPTSGYLGVIFKEPGGRVAFVIWRFPGRQLFTRRAIALTGLRRYELVGAGSGRHFEPRETELPVEALYRIRWGGAGGDAQRRLESITAHWRQFLEQPLREALRQQAPTLNHEEREGLVGRALAEQVTRIVASYGDANGFLRLLVRGEQHLIGIHTDDYEGPIPEDFDVELLPLAVVGRVERARPETGEGETEGSGGSGRGRGRDSEGAQARGGFVYTGADAAAGEGSLFPVVAGGEPVTLTCDPFEGEPTLADLGTDGDDLRQIMQDIAYRLQIPLCDYAGRFALNAAVTIGVRAAAVGTASVREEELTHTVAAPPGGGNLGAVEFTPIPSLSIQLMRHLAGVSPLMSRLVNRIAAAYRRPEHRGRFGEGFSGNVVSWELHFRIALHSRMNEAVGLIFVMTCRVLLLQLLRSSRDAIQTRLLPQNLDTYAALFTNTLLPQLRQLDELMLLRDTLRNFQRMYDSGDPMAMLMVVNVASPDASATPSATWQDARTAVVNSLTPAAPGGGRPGRPGEFVRVNGRLGVRDNQGQVWTMDRLESALVMRRGLLESIDPLIKQFTDLGDVLERFRIAGVFTGGDVNGVRAVLSSILQEMLRHNAEITTHAQDSWQYAFKAGRIQESLPGATVPGAPYMLQGIHLLTHQQIGEFFGGDSYYPEGLDALFSAELGLASLLVFFEFTGLTLLGVLCAPLAFAVGFGLAAHQVVEAYEREHLYQSLIDPELVLTHAEVEAELFAAWLGFVLSFIPEAGSILRGGRTAIRGALRTGSVAVGARLAGRAVLRRASRDLAERLAEGLLQSFVRDMVTNAVIDQVAQRLLGPLVQSVAREASVTGPVGGLAGAQRVQAMLAEELRNIGVQPEGTTPTPHVRH